VVLYYYYLFILYGYIQDEYLMAKRIPSADVVDDNDDHYSVPLQVLRRGDEKEDPPLGAWTDWPGTKEELLP
jgi:hypothetical protein